MSTRIVALIAGATLKSGDEVFVVTARDGTIVNLTGATVVWRRRHAQSPVGIGEEAQTMTVISPPTAGKCTPSYTAVASRALLLGDHFCEVEATLADLSVVKIGNIILRVTEGLAPPPP